MEITEWQEKIDEEKELEVIIQMDIQSRSQTTFQPSSPEFEICEYSGFDI